ncbi:MAG: peptide-methionine (S)-S-oxide reductase MsrA [Pedobacter sp.]|nr:peptide-methionine (S)-S-oxide reductase MsrA [Pedobacter sp.]
MMNLKTIIICLVAMGLFSCNEGQKINSKNGYAVVTPAAAGEAVATFAGGCFWAMQECMVELKGVHKVISGYAGGTTKNPSYEDVLTKTTGHAESVQVYYDPKAISYEKLAEAFFYSHDATQADGQGPDLGSDYRSIAFYRSDNEYQILQNVIAGLDGRISEPVATELVPFEVFYPAETHHQDYYKRNSWDSYIRNVSRPKVLKLRKSMPQLIKSEYKD